MTVETLIKQARERLAQKAYREAHALCMEALKRVPTNPDAFYLLGVLTADHDNHRKAVELFDRALVAQPDLASAWAQKARSLIALNQRDLALKAAQRAAEGTSLDAHTLDTLGVVYTRAGRHADAIAYYERAVEQAPDRGDYLYNYGAALQFIGQMDDARAAYRRAIASNPTDARSYAGIVTITKQTNSDNDIEQLIALFPRFSEDANASLNIGHAIAKAYEDLGDGARALEWLGKAKALKQQSLKYDPDFDRAIFAQAGQLAETSVPSAVDAPGPIFITGMPRTGTTLVDRILSSHSQVTSAGELTDFGLLLKRAVQTPGPYVLDGPTLAAAQNIDLSEIGHAYQRRVRETVKIDTGSFTDKMPLNILYAPLLLQAIPNARVICLLRHPADTVLSNYRQLFATSFSYYNYAYDLEITAQYYAQFRRLVESFSQSLPDTRFTTVAYESVVDDIEAETRRLLDFCGLEFEQACVDFHNNTAPVATASSAQVRQPLYKSALARWKRYRPGIDPALEVLINEGVMDRSELSH